VVLGFLRPADEQAAEAVEPGVGAQLLIGEQPCRQNSSNRPAPAHSWKRRCAELEEQIPVAFSAFHCIPVRNTSNAFHCIPVRNTSRMAFIASRSGTRGLWQPSGCEGRGGSSGSICSQVSSGIRQPSSLATRPIIYLLRRMTREGSPSERWYLPIGIGS
jgi:hypothetical protein